jgi:hypothetical protein
MRTKKPPSPLEKVVQKEAVKLLKSLGWEVHRRNTGAFALKYKGKSRYIKMSEPGMADLWGKMPDGRRFELEIKRSGKRPTKTQTAWLRSQNNSHCAAFWADNTATLERVARHLMAGGRVHYWLDPFEADYYTLAEIN